MYVLTLIFDDLTIILWNTTGLQLQINTQINVLIIFQESDDLN